MKRFLMAITMLATTFLSCEKIDWPKDETTDEPGKPSLEEPEANVRDGMSISITKSTDDTTLPFLCPYGKNEITVEFSISPAVKDLSYKLVSEMDVRAAIHFNSDGTSGKMTVQSNGDLGREPFTIWLRLAEVGKDVNPVWGEYTQWTICPAYIDIRPINTNLPAKDAVVEFVVESNLKLDIELTYSYYLLRDSIVWEDGKCSFRLRDNESYSPIDCNVKVFNEEYKMKSYFEIHQQGKESQQPEDAKNNSGGNTDTDNGSGEEDPDDIIIYPGDMENGGNTEIEF